MKNITLKTASVPGKVDKALNRLLPLEEYDSMMRSEHVAELMENGGIPIRYETPSGNEFYMVKQEDIVGFVTFMNYKKIICHITNEELYNMAKKYYGKNMRVGMDYIAKTNEVKDNITIIRSPRLICLSLCKREDVEILKIRNKILNKGMN